MVSLRHTSRPSGFISLGTNDLYTIFFLLQGVTIFLLFDLKRKIYYLIYEKIMGQPHPSIRRHRLLKAPGHVISSVIAATTTGSLATVQKSPQDEDAAGMIVEAFNATSTGSSNTEEVEEDEQQQRFVGKS